MDYKDNKRIEALPPLVYQQTFNMFPEEATSFYTPQNRNVFHAFLDSIPSDLDMMPPSAKNKALMGQPYEFNLTPEDIEDYTIKEMREEIEHDGVSVFDNENQLVAKAKRKFKNLTKRMSEEEAHEYMRKKYGTYIGMFSVLDNQGVMSTKSHNGHRNLFVREGITIDQLVNKDYEIKPFKYDD